MEKDLQRIDRLLEPQPKEFMEVLSPARYKVQIRVWGGQLLGWEIIEWDMRVSGCWVLRDVGEWRTEGKSPLRTRDAKLKQQNYLLIGGSD